ncbi:Uncharacterised protein [uncultured archaeon]|nr:Uncharacterised protein [uncultured archaeon]
MQQERKDYARAKRTTGILETLKNGTVIVEGKHDIRALRPLGIEALTYSQLYTSLPSASKTVYVLTDADKGGEEKKQKIMAMLLESGNGYVIDDSLGKRLLRTLNSTCVEQVLGPITEIMETVTDGKRIEERREKRIENKNRSESYGENIFGHSKIHGGCEVQHRWVGGQA